VTSCLSGSRCCPSLHTRQHPLEPSRHTRYCRRYVVVSHRCRKSAGIFIPPVAITAGSVAQHQCTHWVARLTRRWWPFRAARGRHTLSMTASKAADMATATPTLLTWQVVAGGGRLSMQCARGVQQFIRSARSVPVNVTVDQVKLGLVGSDVDHHISGGVLCIKPLPTLVCIDVTHPASREQ
jgi:hypothetical protein